MEYSTNNIYNHAIIAKKYKIECEYIQYLMIPVLKSIPEYQIQMQEEVGYPFNGPKSNRYNSTVKIIVPFSKINNNHQRINKIMSIQSENIIKINKITQSYLHKNYTIVYQYVPYRFFYPAYQIQQFIKNKLYKAVLLELITQIVMNGVKPDIDIQNFGFSSDFKLKMFVKPTSQMLNISDPNQRQKFVIHYVNKCQKLFQSKQNNFSNLNLKNKLSNLSEKIKKLNQDIFLKDIKKREKKQSQSGKNSSDNSDSMAKTGSNEKIGNAHWHFDNDFHFQDSYSERDAKKEKKKRSSSFKDGQKPKSESKQKKASWGEQRSSIIESDKVTVLKKRISQALFKTQKALTKYQKIRSRSGNKRKQN